MGRKQIRVYIDPDEWQAVKDETGLEADKDVMDYVMGVYRSVSQLKTINPDPVVAVGVALANYQILGSTSWQRQVNLSAENSGCGAPGASVSQTPPPQSVEKAAPDPLVADNADDW